MVLLGMLGAAMILLGEARSAWEAFRSEAPALSDYAPFCIFVGTMLLAAIGIGISRMQGGVYLALAICVVVLVAGWELDANFNVWRAFPALIALVAMLASGGMGRAGILRALVSTALIVALISTMLLP